MNLQKLPEEWLWNVLEEIKCSDPSSKLCATRRSAGIPFYIQVLIWRSVVGYLLIVSSSLLDIRVSHRRAVSVFSVLRVRSVALF